jgi:hypothetical protein
MLEYVHAAAKEDLKPSAKAKKILKKMFTNH